MSVSVREEEDLFGRRRQGGEEAEQSKIQQESLQTEVVVVANASVGGKHRLDEGEGDVIDDLESEKKMRTTRETLSAGAGALPTFVESQVHHVGLLFGPGWLFQELVLRTENRSRQCKPVCESMMVADIEILVVHKPRRGGLSVENLTSDLVVERSCYDESTNSFSWEPDDDLTQFLREIVASHRDQGPVQILTWRGDIGSFTKARKDPPIYFVISTLSHRSKPFLLVGNHGLDKQRVSEWSEKMAAVLRQRVLAKPSCSPKTPSNSFPDDGPDSSSASVDQVTPQSFGWDFLAPESFESCGLDSPPLGWEFV